MPYRALLFDVGETLWHSPEPLSADHFRTLAAQRAADVLAPHGVAAPADAERAARTAWDAVTAAIKAARQGDRTEPDYIGLVKDALRLEGFALERPDVETLVEAVYISGHESGKVAYPDARAVLLELKRRGFLLATATNRAFGGRRFRCDLVEAGLDIGWDVHAVSVEVGHLKPHPAVFEHALAELDLRPNHALMVGNSLAEDVAGAQQLGIAAAWRRCAPDAEGVEPDFTFDALTELLAIPDLEAPGD